MFSVVVATFNRTTPLRRCLTALADQDVDRHDYEVIVVDDGSSEDIGAVVEEFTGSMDINLYREDRSGPAAARNLGSARARGHFLAFTDSDCVPAKNWLSALRATMMSAPGAAIGGHTNNGIPQNLCADASQCLITFLYRYYNAGAHAAQFLTTNNLAVPIERFRELGGFDESFRFAAGEDRDFCDRWVRRRWTMIYDRAAIISHEHAMGIRSFWRQHFNYGRGAHHFRTLRARRGQEPVRMEPPAFYLGILKAPFADNAWGRGLVLALLLVLSQAANMLGYFARAMRADGNSR